jgi:prepilin-type processing-associated H-X9-DG protein
MSAGTSPDFNSPPGAHKPLQFRLWELLLFVAAASGFMFLSAPLARATISPILAGCTGLVFFALSWWAFRNCKWVEAVVVVCILFTLMALLLPAVQYVHPHRPRLRCTHNLRNIGQALMQYEQTYGSFPPAYIADAAGKPMHSWRVLILPFMEQEAIYKRYDFSEPWDGPNNIKLAPLLNSLYGCHSDSRPGANSQTSYVAVTGPATMWPGSQPAHYADARDGSSNVILVVEVHSSGIQTTEPRDLDILQMPVGISPQSGLGISSGHGNGANVLFLDGSVKWQPQDG